jgi:hypothetical protein
MVLTADDVKVGKTYRGKRFGGSATYNNDRSVVYVSSERVQYDSDTVKNGRHYPTVDMEKFLKWAKRELTKEELEAYHNG